MGGQKGGCVVFGQNNRNAWYWLGRDFSRDIPVARMDVGGDEWFGISDPVEVADIVMSQAPLGPVAGLFFSNPFIGGVAISLGIVGDIDVVIEIPDETGILMLH